MMHQKEIKEQKKIYINDLDKKVDEIRTMMKSLVEQSPSKVEREKEVD